MLYDVSLTKGAERDLEVSPASNKTPVCGRGFVYGSSASVATLYSSSCTKSVALL